MVWDPVHDSRAAFLACLWAQCEPGRLHGPLPRAGLVSSSELDAALSVLLALVDPGVGLAAVGSPDALAAAADVRALAGATEAAVEHADFVLVAAPHDLESPVALRAPRGSPLAPELGATIVYYATTAATRTHLAGPGILGSLRAELPLDPRELDALALASSAPPMGVDALVVVEGGGIVAIPRSTSITVEAA